MNRSIRRFVFVVAAAASLVALARALPTLRAQNAQITQPSEWVPISFRRDDTVNGKLNHSYVEYRSSNGSTRRERNDGHEILITNMSTRKYYSFGHAGWVVQPLRDQKNDGKPFMALSRSSVMEVSEDDPRVALVAKSVSVPVTFYEMPLGSAGSVILSPELNLLDVWRKVNRPGEGEVIQTITAITVGEPTVSWEPPSDARLTESPVQGGRGSAVPPPGVPLQITK